MTVGLQKLLKRSTNKATQPLTSKKRMIVITSWLASPPQRPSFGDESTHELLQQALMTTSLITKQLLQTILILSLWSWCIDRAISSLFVLFLAAWRHIITVACSPWYKVSPGGAGYERPWRWTSSPHCYTTRNGPISGHKLVFCLYKEAERNAISARNVRGFLDGDDQCAQIGPDDE